MNKRQPIHPLISAALFIVLALVVLMPLSTLSTQANPAALIVRPNGKIATGDVCPTPATSADYKNVQAAIDCAADGDTISIYPGTYAERADNRPEFGTGTGDYSFGLYIGKNNLRIQGVDAAGVPIASFGAVRAIINSQVTSSFGVQGVFVSGANVTISGLLINPHAPGDNKTLEIVGDNFTLRHSHITSSGGSALYFRDARFVGNATSGTSTLKRFAVSDNLLDGGSVVLTNGTGFGAPSSGQRISGNLIRNTLNWAISLSGSTTLSSALVYPVGAPLISNNIFESNAFGVLRAFGIYEMTDAQINAFVFDNSNTFKNGWVIAYKSDGVSLRTTLSLGYDTRREVGTVIDNQASRTMDNVGDIVRVGPGTYTNQTVTINRNRVTLQGSGTGQTFISGTNCTSAGITLASSHSGLVVRDLTVSGHLDGIVVGQNTLVTTNNTLIEDVRVTDNCRHGIYSTANSTSGLTVNRALVANNGTSANPSGTNGRGFWINGGIKNGVTITNSTFTSNQFAGIDVGSGNVTNLLISANRVEGAADFGIAVNGAQGIGANLIQNNVVSGARYGIELRNASGNGTSSGAGSVAIIGNTVRGVLIATANDSAGIIVNRRAPNLDFVADQPSGVMVSENTVSGYVNNGSGDGFGIVIEGNTHWVLSNTVQNNDVGLMLQAGGTLNTTGTDYFDRGNASATRQQRVRGNMLTANGDGLVSLGTVSGAVNNNNLIYSNGRDGVRVLDEASTGLVVNNNQICMNTQFGVRNRGTSTLNARSNWWGSSDGPGPVGLGSGEEVGPRVDFSAFLTTAPSDSPCQPHTATPTVTYTPTPITPTATFTPTYTPTPITPTATFTPTYTPTPVTPTATFTPTYTPTPVTPTATFTPSNTPTPITPTATFTPSNTPTPVTHTPTFTPSNTPTPVTHTPTFTPSNTPTATFTPTPTFTETPIPSGALRLEKIVAWGYATPVNGTTFKLCINGPSYPNWSCQIVSYPDALVAFWDGLIPGVYAISEENPGADWAVSYTTTQVNIVNGQTARESVTNTNTAPPFCKVQPGPKSDLGGYIKLIDGVAYGYVTNNSATACVYPIGLAVYYAYNENIDDQYIFSADVRDMQRIEVGQTITLTAPMPGSCYVQVDLFYGHLISPMFNGQRYGSRLFGALHPNKATPCLNLPDSDGDGLRDPIDPDNGTFNDKDGDGIGDGHDPIFNDLDGDGIADAFDDDRDGDGHSNRDELLAGSNPDDANSVPPPPPTASPTPDPSGQIEPPADGGVRPPQPTDVPR